MKFSSFFIALFLLGTSLVNAQKKNITLDDIWTDGTFKQESLDALRSMQNGEEYTVLNFDKEKRVVTIDAYSYKTGKKTQTIVNSKDISGLQYFQTYDFNTDETKVLLSTELEPIYRRSTKGIYFVYDLKNKSLTKISDQKIKEPSFSPDGTKVAYAFENNLYIKDLKSGKVTQITKDGKENHIINGTTDWVYEEEFAFTRAYEWNKSGNKIGFLRFDESEVPTFTMEIYGTYPNRLYPKPYQIKYPKAGEKNSEVTLHLYDLNSGELKKVNLKKNYEYLPRIKWTKAANILSVQAMNRHQNDLDLIFVDANNNSSQVILNEKDKDYIDITDNLTFLNDNSFFWTSEKSNWNHIYHYSKTGKLIKQLTEGDWDVTAFYGFDAKKARVYYQSTENGNVNRDIYSVNINGGNKIRLSERTGTNSADFGSNFKYYINTFSNLKTPPVYTVYKAFNGKEIRVIKDNHELKNNLKEYNISPKEISTIHINGNDLNMWMIKPTDFDPNKKYPLLLYQYSGPGSQQVSNSFMTANDYWYEMLAEQGYVIACVDGRGTGFKGADFKKVTQLELGKYEVQDQIAVAQKMGERDYIDKDRIGIWGWSYGGFMASNCIFQGGDTFKMAIAVAPVTSWRFYDSVYTERYMTTPQENPNGYDNNSPITHVSEFNDDNHFLLIHGSGDDNVHVQNSMQMIEALIQAGKNFDWEIYPDNNHGIYGGNTRNFLYNKMTNFIKNNL